MPLARLSAACDRQQATGFEHLTLLASNSIPTNPRCFVVKSLPGVDRQWIGLQESQARRLGFLAARLPHVFSDTTLTLHVRLASGRMSRVSSLYSWACARMLKTRKLYGALRVKCARVLSHVSASQELVERARRLSRVLECIHEIDITATPKSAFTVVWRRLRGLEWASSLGPGVQRKGTRGPYQWPVQSSPKTCATCGCPSLQIRRRQNLASIGGTSALFISGRTWQCWQLTSEFLDYIFLI